MTAVKALLFTVFVLPASAFKLFDLFGNATATTECVGPSCCPSSSCWTFVPMLGCRADRGECTCVGSSFLRFKAGVCQCSSGQVCSSFGTCGGVATGTVAPVPAQVLYEVDGDQQMQAVPPENVSPVRVLLATLGVGLIITGLAMMACGRKQSGKARQASRGHSRCPDAEQDLVE